MQARRIHSTGYTLVVCEKPDAARRIAHALGDAVETRNSGISVFKIAPKGDSGYIVCSALGHLYGLVDVAGNRAVFPVLDLRWIPLETNPKARRIVAVISELAKEAKSFVHACDYDQEGEVIGYSILEYACNGKYGSALRAKFSTLTDEEIRESFEHLEKTNGNLAEAGRSRHLLDFIYGVNLSRALASSFQVGNSGGYRNLSIGRVQGPTLAFVADRELAIRLHVPDPYWTVQGEFSNPSQDSAVFTAHYEKPRIDTLAQSRAIVTDCAGVDGTVRQVASKNLVLRPPTPFNIGDLQKEAYRTLRISPGYTLAIAEKLYLSALISYPRTSSQKLPPSIGYRKILSGISQIGSGYGHLTSLLLGRSKLFPHEGAKTDPAHPAIYPTGVAPRRKLGGLEFKLYDLIIKRFLATFGDPATVLKTEIAIEIPASAGSPHVFLAEGRVVIYDGWMVFYKPYVWAGGELALPDLKQGDTVKNNRVGMEEKFTQPPYRYTQASLLAKMEEEGIGTKATRADIIATLFKRNYVEAAGKGGMQATDLGLSVVESMKSYVPSIISPDLTKRMEEDLEKVEQGDSSALQVIEGAVDRLVESLAAFRRREREIGVEIAQAVASEARQTAAAAIVGDCPSCKTGKLRIITSRTSKKRFIGCSNFAAGCKASAPLPQRGGIRKGAKVCVACNWPILHIYFARRGKPWTICPNMACPSRENKSKPQASL